MWKHFSLLPSGHAWMWELGHEESWAPKNAFKLWCWRRLLRVPWTARRSNQSIKKETNHEYSLQVLMFNLKLHYFGHLMWQANSLEDTDAGKNWRQKKKVTEDKMAGWHHQCNGHELGQTLGDDEGQRGLACCSPWGHKELDTTGRLNINNHHLFPISPMG